MTTEQAKALAEDLLSHEANKLPERLQHQAFKDALVLARAVLDLTAELAKAKADVVVLRDGLKPFSYLSELFDSSAFDYGPITHLDADGDHDLMLCDLRQAARVLTSTTSGAELLAEVARLRANQRTAGFQERCQHRYERDGLYNRTCNRGPGNADLCDIDDCPIRSAKVP